MKKFLILIIVLLLASSLYAENGVTSNKDIKTIKVPIDGRAKIGVILGSPIGATFGYRFSNWFETNFIAGYDFCCSNAGMVGINGLFTLVNIGAGKAGVLPLSLGPQINFLFGGYKPFMMDILADLRLEYTFRDIPLNLFGEFGAGIRLFDRNGVNFAFNSGLGIRYVF